MIKIFCVLLLTCFVLGGNAYAEETSDEYRIILQSLR
jgi:hypothetical protein